MTLPTTVDGVLARLREIDVELTAGDGAKVFNAMYLTVTQRIATAIAAGPIAGTGATPTFHDPDAVADLDVRFACLWLTAYDDASGHLDVPKAWRPVFATRDAGREPIQYALAGMNTHIEHDLPIAVVESCQARGATLDAVHADFLAVNDVLAQAEAEIRRSFLDQVGRAADAGLGRLVHLVSCWSIDKARDVSWVTAETLWSLRGTAPLRDRFLEGLADTVGMTTSALLVPIV